MIHQEELKFTWDKTNAAYETFMEERAAEQEAEIDEDKPTTRSKTQCKSTDEAANLREVFKAKYDSTYVTYCNCLTLLGEIHDNLKRGTTALSGNSVSIPTSRPVSNSFQLPACDTSVFHGDYFSWPTFRYSFTATFIQSNLSPVQKLLHLRQKTKGEAFDIVSKAPLENSGFDIAWHQLCNRFQNKKF